MSGSRSDEKKNVAPRCGKDAGNLSVLAHRLASVLYSMFGNGRMSFVSVAVDIQEYLDEKLPRPIPLPLPHPYKGELEVYGRPVHVVRGYGPCNCNEEYYSCNVGGRTLYACVDCGNNVYFASHSEYLCSDYFNIPGSGPADLLSETETESELDGDDIACVCVERCDAVGDIYEE